MSELIWPTVAVAFAAFCIWLVVRIVNRREGWAIWTAVAIALLLYITWLTVIMEGRAPFRSTPSPDTWVED